MVVCLLVAQGKPHRSSNCVVGKQCYNLGRHKNLSGMTRWRELVKSNEEEEMDNDLEELLTFCRKSLLSVTPPSAVIVCAALQLTYVQLHT